MEAKKTYTRHFDDETTQLINNVLQIFIKISDFNTNRITKFLQEHLTPKQNPPFNLNIIDQESTIQIRIDSLSRDLSTTFLDVMNKDKELAEYINMGSLECENRHVEFTSQEWVSEKRFLEQFLDVLQNVVEDKEKANEKVDNKQVNNKHFR